VYSGEKVTICLEFQDISNANCFIACDDPVEILSFDFNDLLDLKKTICVKLNINSFTVLPGIKSKMNLLKSKLMKKCNTLKKDVSKIPSNIILTKHPSVNTLKALIMSDTPSNINLTEQVLSFRNELFYDLVKQQCGTIALEIMQVQDISSVECLLEISDIFSFLELDSDELISIKRKSGIFRNDGRFVLKKD
ncbi:unnamed protein product, partial [Rotaria magnacalcarata]